jgi:uncharacterized caspase-like protein
MRFANFLRMLMLFSWMFIPTLAVAEKRVALVVGNGAYTHATRLNNPVNDAKDVTEALKRLGFEVVQGNDVSNEKFDDLIQSFSSKLAGADIALFYYSGHGLQFEGANYLVPVDSKIEGVYALKKRAVIAQDVVNMMEREAKASLVFLDACRNNTLVRDLEQSLPAQSRNGSGARGLARMAQSGNSLIAFAAAPNDVAADGTGQRNSPFTAAVLKHIETPNVVVPEMLTEVTADVTKATSNRQKPEVLSRLTTQVRLKVASVAVPVQPPLPNREEAARVIWSNELEKTCAKNRLVLFQGRYADTYYGDLAKARLGDIEAGRECVPDISAGTSAKSKADAEAKLKMELDAAARAKAEAEAVAKAKAEAEAKAASQAAAEAKAKSEADAAAAKAKTEAETRAASRAAADAKAKSEADAVATKVKAVAEAAAAKARADAEAAASREAIAAVRKCDPDENLINGKCVTKPAKKCDLDEDLINGKCVTKPAKVVTAPKKCDPDENLVNGKCHPKPQNIAPAIKVPSSNVGNNYRTGRGLGGTCDYTFNWASYRCTDKLGRDCSVISDRLVCR